MKRRIVGALSALALAGLGAVVCTAPAAATPVRVSMAKIVDSPDDGCPKAWARDTFQRKTVITPAGIGKWNVTITDDGTFITQPTAPSPQVPATLIAAKVPGILHGSGHYSVTGKLKSFGALHALNGQVVNNSAAVCKTNIDEPKKTANWAKQFFEPGVESTGITGWKWSYKTCAESRTETEQGADNNIVGKLCDAKVKFEKPSCRDRDAELTVFNPNKYESIQVGFGAAPAVTVLPGKSTKHEFHSGSVQVMVNGAAFGSPFVYQPPKHCKPVLSWDAGITATPTCAVNSTTVKVVNDGHVTFHAKLGDTSQYLKPGESIEVTFSAGKVLLWVNHKLVKSFEHKAAVCPPPVDNPDPNPPVDNPPAPGAGGGDTGGSDTSGDVPTLPQTGVLRSMWTTPTAFSAYGVLIVLVGAALFVLNRRRKYVVEA